jgi:hypothetical protein
MGQRRGGLSRRRVRCVSGFAVRTFVAVVLVATGFVTSVAAGASAALPTLTVTPMTNLVGGQTVSVTGSDWIAGHRIVLCQSGNEAPDVRDSAAFGDFCAGVPGVAVTADTAGKFTHSVAITRVVVANTGTLDCADPTNSCYEGATDRSVSGGASTAINIFFAPMCGGLPAAPHTSYTLSNGNAVGSVATFAADHDYVLVGEALLTCQANGEWSGPAPTAMFTGSPLVIPGSATVAEGNVGTTVLKVPVTLSQDTTHAVTAHWKTAFVTGASANQADPATDYTPASGTVNFPAGVGSAVATILVKGDTLVEPDEYIVVQFGNATGATIGGFYGLGEGVITNDDGVPVIVPGSASVAEGNAGNTALSVPVKLSKSSTVTVTVQWRTVFVAGAPGNQAAPFTDYDVSGGIVTFAPGATTASATFQVFGDTVIEPDEYVIVQFGSPIHATIGPGYGLGKGVIANDDGTPSVTVTPSTGLVDGQTVAITGSGWTPGHSVALCEGGNEGGGGDDGTGCNNGPHALVTVNNAGNFSGSLVITSEVFVPTLSATIDCTDEFDQCWAGAADSLHLTQAVGSLIFFASTEDARAPGKSAAVDDEVLVADGPPLEVALEEALVAAVPSSDECANPQCRGHVRISFALTGRRRGRGRPPGSGTP